MVGLLNKGNQQQPGGQIPEAGYGRPQQGGGMQPMMADGEDGEESNVSPEEQEQYNAFVGQALNLIYDEKMLPQVMDRMKSSGDPVEALASLTVLATDRVAKSAQRNGMQMSPDVIFHGGAAIMEDLATLAERAGVHSFTDGELEAATYQAVDQYRQREQAEGNLDEGPIKEDMNSLISADMEGRIDEALVPGVKEKFGPIEVPPEVLEMAPGDQGGPAAGGEGGGEAPPPPERKRGMLR